MIAQRKRMDIQTWSGRRGGGVGRGGDVAVDVCCCLPTTFYLETCVHLPDETNTGSPLFVYGPESNRDPHLDCLLSTGHPHTLRLYTRGPCFFLVPLFRTRRIFFQKHRLALLCVVFDSRLSIEYLFRFCDGGGAAPGAAASEASRNKGARKKSRKKKLNSDPHSFQSIQTRTVSNEKTESKTETKHANPRRNSLRNHDGNHVSVQPSR